MSSKTCVIFAATFLPRKRDILLKITPVFWHYDFFWRFLFSAKNNLIEFICICYKINLGIELNLKIIKALARLPKDILFWKCNKTKTSNFRFKKKIYSYILCTHDTIDKTATTLCTVSYSLYFACHKIKLFCKQHIWSKYSVIKFMFAFCIF